MTDLTSELIRRKRDGEALSPEQLNAWIAGVTDGQVSDAQIAAMAMAVFFQGMSTEETGALTRAMRDSGDVLQWSDLDGPVLDKHSTGGIGDLASLVVGPLVAACGGYVPMISGRGLGHTGGTLDKLESIPGYRTQMDRSEFQQIVTQERVSIIGQTKDLAPADARIYAVRDQTATVASVPLIVSSILSKKLAEGLDGLVMDVKVGRGAFMESFTQASELCQGLCQAAADSGLACESLITDMSSPISSCAGNALEVHEAICMLKDEPVRPRLRELVLALTTELLVTGKLFRSHGDARQHAVEALSSGAAAERFAAMVFRHGGPADLLEKAEDYLPAAAVVRPLTSDRPGYVCRMDMLQLGWSVVALGGGRIHPGARLDHAVGLSGLCRPGQQVEEGDTIMMIHARDEQVWHAVAERCRTAVEIAAEPKPSDDTSVVIGRWPIGA